MTSKGSVSPAPLALLGSVHPATLLDCTLILQLSQAGVGCWWPWSCGVCVSATVETTLKTLRGHCIPQQDCLGLQADSCGLGNPSGCYHGPLALHSAHLQSYTMWVLLWFMAHIFWSFGKIAFQGGRWEREEEGGRHERE